MIVRTRDASHSRRPAPTGARPLFRRNAMCRFIAMALFGGAAHAATPPPFSQAWLAAKQTGSTQAPAPTQANGAGNNGGNVFTPGNVMLQQRVQQSIANLDAAAQAVAAQMAAQKSAQQAAQQVASNVPDGIAAGGLKVDRHVLSDPTLWQNADAPTQSVTQGQTDVEIRQNAPKAIMTWETFNVGRNTTVHFDQTGGTRTDGTNQWIALNRISDPTGNPSQILGQVKAEGTVYLLNRNGVIFGGGSQVNTHSLIASSMDLFSHDVTKSNAFFMKYGIAATQDPELILGPGGTVNAFLVADETRANRSSVTVQKGATIASGKDGYVMLASDDVGQAGQIVADDGQVILAASSSLRMASTATNGRLPVTGVDVVGSTTPTTIVNTGLIQARRGSVSWFGNDMRQDGVVVTSTSLSHPGRLSFDNIGGPAKARVTFGAGSTTTILPEKDGETTSSSADADKAFVPGSVNINTPAVLEPGALMEVPSGKVTFTQDAYVDSGATIDVSGLANVTLPMSALMVIIPRIGLNELADSPLLRSSFLFAAKNVAVDSGLSGVRADGLDWVGSPVLNVAGYVNNVPRTVDELMIRSGDIAFNRNAVIRTGAQLRLEGGFLNYLPGCVSTSRLQGANGLLYDVASADPDVAYTGFAGVYTSEHARWGVAETFTTSPLLANAGRWDPGFIRGGDAGELSFGLTGDLPSQSLTFILDGDISAHAYAGREQVRAGKQPLAGTLDIVPVDLAVLGSQSSYSVNQTVNYVVQRDRVPLQSYVPGFDDDSIIPPLGGDPDDPSNPFRWRVLSTAMIDNAGFRRVRLSTPGTVLLRDDANLGVADGGEVDITALGLDLKGTITARAGTIDLTSRSQGFDNPDNADTFIRLGAGARLNASGRFVNDAARSADEAQGDAWINGGSVSLTTWRGADGGRDLTADITLARGSVVDVSGGGYVGSDGLLAMDGGLPAGRGGDVSIQTHADGNATVYSVRHPDDLMGGAVTMDGTLVANGFSGGGTLTLRAPQIQIGGDATPSPDASLLYLDPSMFSTMGFSRYSLLAETDATIAPEAHIDVRPKYMVADERALTLLPGDTALLGGDGQAAVASVADIDDYQRYTHRDSDDGIAIQAGFFLTWGAGATLRGVTGTVSVGDGASIAVGAGGNIALSSTDHVVVDGSLVAHGGDISLRNIGGGSFNLDEPGRSLWLGARSIVDVSGVSLRDPAAGPLPAFVALPSVRRDGVVLNGGAISLVSDRNVVAEQGARLLLSGAHDTYDLPVDGRRAGIASTDYIATSVWSDAGSLGIESRVGLYFDASIDAHGGAAEARGGQLNLSTTFPFTGQIVPPPELIIEQSGWRVPTGSDPYAPTDPGQGDGGDLRFAADRLGGSGIDDIVIGRRLSDDETGLAPLALVFAGDVNLRAGHSVQVVSNTITTIDAGSRLPTASNGVAEGGHVTLAAPYVSLLGHTQRGAPQVASGSGTLDVDAGFIDIGGRISLLGVDHASFNSSGDIRFWAPARDAYAQAAPVAGWLYSTGDLDFTGTRVYPATDYRFLVDASNPSADTTVAFHQAARTDDTTPLSAGGTLVVDADHIRQEGTIWAPSGALALGTDDPQATLAALGVTVAMPMAVTRDVRLAAGSVTSVSLGGAVVPYGTTVDGKDWHYDGNPSATEPVVARPPEKSLSIAGNAVSLDAGAHVDLSGGGYVQATEWVPGTGGSRDVLAQYNTSYATSQQGTRVPLYADGRAIYAVVPGYDAPLSAHDAAFEASGDAGPAVGQGVYLSGVPGLADGVYTLLPARYATLPGAYRVVQDTGMRDAVPGRSVTMPDGTDVVSGYFTDTLTGARDARASSFLVQSAATWGQYSEYTVTSADTFFADKAARAGDVAPRLGADAGRLTLAASSELSLGATLDAAPAMGGRGSQVDIAGEAIQVLGQGQAALDGYLHISADELSTLGAGSLLIGGKRESTADGDRVSVLADHVVLSNDAAHPLTGSEIILVARGNGAVTLGDGSLLRATATADASSAPLLIGQQAADGAIGVSGDGALLRVSGLDAAPISRANITGLDGPAGTPGGDLVIGSGASIVSANSLSMDATGLTQLATDAGLSAHAIDVTAGRIGLVAADPSLQDQAGHLLIGPRILAQLASSAETTLRGRGGLDLDGDIALNAGANALTLSAPTIESDGGHAVIDADRFTLVNDTGAAPAPPATGAATGSLEVNAREFHLGDGIIRAAGFSQWNIHASGGFFASGTGTLDLAGSAATVVAPRVVVDSGADNRVTTRGAMLLRGDGGSSAATRQPGGKLGLQAASLDLATDILAPGGRVTLHATQGDVVLEDGATIDVGGMTLPFNDVSVHVPGGAAILEADRGNVDARTGSRIDVSGDVAGGDAGTLNVSAAAGSASFAGQLLGTAATNYFGGVLSVDTFGPVDLDGLASVADAGGLDGSVSVHTRNGDLVLSAGHLLRAHLVGITADGGDVSIAGTVDASAKAGGAIDLFGAQGVDIDGTLDTHATLAGRTGGDITLGTSGTGTGDLDPTYGYEVVQAGTAGHIRIGAGATVDQRGDVANGHLYLRAPLLEGGDTPVTIAGGIDPSRTAGTTLEAYAVWDTRDASTDPTRHFDGLVDAGGWFESDPATGRPVLVAGSFTDDSGAAVADPDRTNDAQVEDYLARYRFTPTATDTGHTGFYGYIGGDPAQGAGTLMRFVEQPGFTFGSRLASVAGLKVRPGIELRNGDVSKNGGDISVLTNWNLGAGTKDADGTLQLAYRYDGQAPVLSLRAENNLDVRASITDGFYQQGNAGGGSGAAPPDHEWTHDEAEQAWQQVVNLGGFEGDLFGAPADLVSDNAQAKSDYYMEYFAYANYLVQPIDQLAGFTPVDVINFGIAFGGNTTHYDNAPTPLAVPTNLTRYVSYVPAYGTYLLAATSPEVSDFANTFQVPDTFVPMAPPPVTGEPIDRSAPVDNSPSPVASATNPLPILSATLAGGTSSSYRLVAGADLTSANPLGLAGGRSADVLLGGHTDFADTTTGRVLAAPTAIRTGTGDIDIVASGDVRWTDERAPAVVYTAGAPVAGTTANAGVSILRPSQAGLIESATPELVVTGPVNSDNGGHVSLHAGGDIVGVQDSTDTTGDLTGTVGTPTAQYWWQWMQTGNTATQSSINFGGFGQGVMSVGGDVDVAAGGDIRQLSVSLPTTWAIDTDATGTRTLHTYGGGDLTVRAGGDILSGNYFVARGEGDIRAGGRIGSDFSLPYLTAGGASGSMPVSTLFGMQDAQLSVQAGGSVALGGIFNPSWMDSAAIDDLLPVGHADGQSYSVTSRVDVMAGSGDLSYGDLTSPLGLFTPGLVSGSSLGTETAGDILPASVSLTAAQGDLNLRASGELFPSSDGNLALLAQGSVHFDMPALGAASRYAWGLIDAPLSSMASPLNLEPLIASDQTPANNVRTGGYLVTGFVPDQALQSFVHAASPWHANDDQPIRVYALDGDIVNGSGGGVGGAYVVANKSARIQAGRDIVDLAYVGQQLRDSDISVVRAGRDIVDTPLDAQAPSLDVAPALFPLIVQGGPGYLTVEAGRDLGRLASQTELYGLDPFVRTKYLKVSLPGNTGVISGIDTVGNVFNPNLPPEGASIYAMYGVGPGLDRAAFIARYVDPSAVKPGGLDDGSATLVAFVEAYDAGLRREDGAQPVYSVDEAWARFQQLPVEAQSIFVGKTFTRILAQVGRDYGDANSPYAGQYARGYDAVNTLFPASLGYTANGLGGGDNGAQQLVHTGDLDIRGSTIQTQRGGDVSVLAPGGQALLGSVSAPPTIVDNLGKVLAGPNTLGILTLRDGSISMFADGSTLLAQSRIFTEQGGDVTIWSSNGDINAGKGAKTSSEIPPANYLCTLDGWCAQDPSGQVSGAGIATLQTTPGAPAGNAYLMAPRGTVDAGDAGIRVAGNLVIAAAHVANADNVQVKGDAVGLPVVQAVNVSALNAASSAASAATKAAEDVARQQQSDARDRMPSTISVQVLGNDPSASIDGAPRGGYDTGSPVQVVRSVGHAGDGLTQAERARVSRQ
ncbi:filamentous hemagglutinin family protein [Luteibacter sp. 1214]|uniref:filamentous haemagglutinin family protein n=1 Tax=Luteibacter sp. 1214 TaxID=2817735 RepID=UPI0028638721|nr:filamentous haemagglutinin family protein [Luteibacter sp. 1214]MDR6644712.1 filamentous hemagglutinin family protein [Luteibacter sp. 1214]